MTGVKICFAHTGYVFPCYTACAHKGEGAVNIGRHLLIACAQGTSRNKIKVPTVNLIQVSIAPLQKHAKGLMLLPIDYRRGSYVVDQAHALLL